MLLHTQTHVHTHMQSYACPYLRSSMNTYLRANSQRMYMHGISMARLLVVGELHNDLLFRLLRDRLLLLCLSIDCLPLLLFPVRL